MAILKGILEDSLEYYRDLDRRLRARLKALAHGSLLKRKIGRKEYYYLIFRQKGRVVSRYLGRERPVQLEKDIQERRLARRQLKEVAESLKTLHRLEGRKKHGRPVSKRP